MNVVPDSLVAQPTSPVRVGINHGVRRARPARSRSASSVVAVSLVAVAASAVLAGCSGLPKAGSLTAAPTTAANSGDAAGGTGEAGAAGGAGAGASANGTGAGAGAPSPTGARDTGVVLVGNRVFRVKFADTVADQTQGLVGRQSLPPGSGLLMRFATEQVAKLHMSGVTFPVDAAFIQEGAVVKVVAMTPCTQPQEKCPIYSSGADQVDSVLEVGAGELTGVTPGTRVELDK